MDSDTDSEPDPPEPENLFKDGTDTVTRTLGLRKGMKRAGTYRWVSSMRSGGLIGDCGTCRRNGTGLDIEAFGPDDCINNKRKRVEFAVVLQDYQAAYAARDLKAAGSAGVEVDPTKLIWTPYNAEKEYANFRG